MLLKLLDSANPSREAIVDILYEDDKFWWLDKTPGAFANLTALKMPAYLYRQDDGSQALICADYPSNPRQPLVDRCVLDNFGGLALITRGSTGKIKANNGGMLKAGPMQWLGLSG